MSEILDISAPQIDDLSSAQSYMIVANMRRLKIVRKDEALLREEMNKAEVSASKSSNPLKRTQEYERLRFIRRFKFLQKKIVDYSKLFEKTPFEHVLSYYMKEMTNVTLDETGNVQKSIGRKLLDAIFPNMETRVIDWIKRLADREWRKERYKIKKCPELA